MLVSGCEKVEGILYTHEHSDHTAGLDDIRPFNFRQGDIPIYAHERVIENLKRRFDYVFETENKYPGAPSVKAIEVINNVPFAIGDKMAIPINAYHGNLQIFGYRIDDFAYLTDVKTIEQDEVNKLAGVKVLVLNALREEAHHSHLNLEEALELVELVKPQRTYLTYSHTFGFHADIQKKLPANVFVAYDNLEITV
jgi:phosphoribosyl 1,2-cyclic phosphate phosphodiesterase